MRLVSRTLLAAAACLLAATSASHAQARGPNWSGFYAGASGGYGWLDLAGTEGFLETDGLVFGITPSTFQRYPASDSNDKFGGWFGGVQVGYQQQWGAWLAGIETDIQWSDIEEKGQSLGSEMGPTYNTSAELEYFGTLRLRSGWTVGNVLFYATGGLAYGRAAGKVSVMPGTPASPGLGGPYAGSDGKTMVGWTVGGGIEIALSEAISVKAEYLHLDLGDADFRFDLAGADGSYIKQKQALDLDIVRIGLNVRF